ncbi:hypothetical protein F0562_027368 [Nyssa sinensis]|uniref:Uncharacterized protein n=1 Tax=Nyssa sinensis TaxID=561372 RepID=A0A5J5B840_9ASTE|nr:hypothetical protein F0562_027368 [Nyssa sinensis]
MVGCFSSICEVKLLINRPFTPTRDGVAFLVRLFLLYLSSFLSPCFSVINFRARHIAHIVNRVLFFLFVTFSITALSLQSPEAQPFWQFDLKKRGND